MNSCVNFRKRRHNFLKLNGTLTGKIVNSQRRVDININKLLNKNSPIIRLMWSRDGLRE